LSDCDIEFVGLERNGQTRRFWCRKHFAKVHVNGAIPQSTCERAHIGSILESEVVRIDPISYDGGVALWGALPPAYNTSPEQEAYGVHLHAREAVGIDAVKTIDGTYQMVEVCVGQDLFGDRGELIDTETATSYFATLTYGLQPKALSCSHCNRPHLDSGIFAIRPHRKHRCNFCGRDFFDDERGVGNPLMAVKDYFQDSEIERVVERSPEVLDISQSDFAGGIAIWASNPAAFWTQPKPEHSGIHVHGYDQNGKRDLDETIGSLTIDGVRIRRKSVRLLMAQKLIYEDLSVIHAVKCPYCNANHLDDGSDDWSPHEKHECNECGEDFVSAVGKPVVANPIIEKIRLLQDSLEADK